MDDVGELLFSSLLRFIVITPRVDIIRAGIFHAPSSLLGLTLFLLLSDPLCAFRVSFPRKLAIRRFV